MINVAINLKSRPKLNSFIANIPYTLSKALNSALYDTRDKLVGETFAHIEVQRGRGRRAPAVRRKESGRTVLKVQRSDEFNLSGKIIVDLGVPKEFARVGHLVTAHDWIHAFVHSTSEAFAGKTKKERIRMALGAYYRNKRTSEFKQAAAKLDTNLYEQRFNRLMLENSLYRFPVEAKKAARSA